VPQATLGLMHWRTKEVCIPCLCSGKMRQAIRCPSACRDPPMNRTQTSYAHTRALIRRRAGIAPYNRLFARSIVTRLRGVASVFLPWGKGLKKFQLLLSFSQLETNLNSKLNLFTKLKSEFKNVSQSANFWLLIPCKIHSYRKIRFSPSWHICMNNNNNNNNKIKKCTCKAWWNCSQCQPVKFIMK